MTVVELWPFGGWYTEIIAPYVKGQGTYYAAALKRKHSSAPEGHAQEW
jgi:predicted methyltransferase